MKKLHFIVILGFAMFLGNCAIGPVYGLVYTQSKFAGEFNPNNDVKVNKTAEGCSNSIFGIANWGKAGAGYIAYTNSIERIATIDHSTLNVLGIYRNYCTIVSGEGK